MEEKWRGGMERRVVNLMFHASPFLLSDSTRSSTGLSRTYS